MVNRLVFGVLIVLSSPACNESVTEPSGKSPVRPTISVSREVGEPPLEGSLHLTPDARSLTWRYEVDLDEDGTPDQAGDLLRATSLAYRFETPGIHHLTISLSAPGDAFTVDFPMVVIDSNLRVVNQHRLHDLTSEIHRTFEGIAIDHAGRSLFVGDFYNSQIYQIDPESLQPLAGPIQLPRLAGGVEGLSVTPSDSLLVVAHKHHGLSVVAIPSMEVRRAMYAGAEYFIHAVDDTLAIGAGAYGLVLIDTRSGAEVRRIPYSRGWHFAVSSEKDLIAVIVPTPPTLHLVSMTSFQEVGQIPLPMTNAEVVAFDPHENKAYLGWGGQGESVFVVVDLDLEAVMLRLPLGAGTCGIFCVANPVATSRDGHWVAMEQGGGVYFIDTTLDRPRYFTGFKTGLSGMSVAASPVEDAFYLLRSDGLLMKVRIEQ